MVPADSSIRPVAAPSTSAVSVSVLTRVMVEPSVEVDAIVNVPLLESVPEMVILAPRRQRVAGSVVECPGGGGDRVGARRVVGEGHGDGLVEVAGGGGAAEVGEPLLYDGDRGAVVAGDRVAAVVAGRAGDGDHLAGLDLGEGAARGGDDGSGRPGEGQRPEVAARQLVVVHVGERRGGRRRLVGQHLRLDVDGRRRHRRHRIGAVVGAAGSRDGDLAADLDVGEGRRRGRDPAAGWRAPVVADEGEPVGRLGARVLVEGELGEVGVPGSSGR